MRGLDRDFFHFREELSAPDCRTLADHAALKRIQFHEARPSRKTLELINEIVFARRKDVALRVYGYGDEWADISFLSLLPELERFNWETDTFGPLEPLYLLKRLTALGLGFSNAKKKALSLRFLTDFTQSLEGVTLMGDYKHIESLGELTNLKLAWFASTKLENFDFITHLPLETFGNYGSRVKSFDSLTAIKSIKSLWIKAHNNLTEIDFVRGLTNLERLELFWLPRLVRLPDLSHLEKLKYIQVFQGKRFEDYSGALNLRNCHITVSGPLIRPNRFLEIDTPQ